MAGYGVMAAITLLTGVAAVLPGVQARALAGALLLAVGWWLYISRSRSRLRLADEALCDPLTGLYTRRHLAARLDEEVARAARYGGVLSVAVLDLDDFKGINDQYGHLHGDEVLRTFGTAIRAVLRKADVAFRYGGDECVVLFAATPASAAETVLERLRRRLPDTPFSGGIAEHPRDATEAMALLRVADGRLLETKRGGKGRVSGRGAAR